ncbi:MAG: ABC transporter permease [Deltaproteobacteria bacterium]|nr:ABC transporter permease [Deltaproteobacteria bacterium]
MRWVTASFAAAFLGCTAAILTGFSVPVLADLTFVLVLAKAGLLLTLVLLAVAVARPEWRLRLALGPALLLLAVPVSTLAAAPAAALSLASFSAVAAFRKGRAGAGAALVGLALLCAGRGVLDFLRPGYAPWAAAAVGAGIGSALAAWALRALSLRSRAPFLAALGCWGVAIGTAVAVRLAPAARFNVTMALFVVGFIIAAAGVAALFTWLFLKAFERLDKDLFHAFLFFVPVTLAPIYLVAEQIASAALGAEHPAWRWGAFAPAADGVLLAAFLLLLSIREAGRRIGPANPVLRTAWKFLRSQQMVQTAATRRDLALRRLVPAPRPGNGELLGWGTAAAVAVAAGALLLSPLLDRTAVPPFLVRAAGLAAAAAWFTRRALSATTAKGRWNLLPACLLAAGAALELRVAAAGEDLPLRLLPPAAAALPILLLLLQYATRLLLAVRLARGRLPRDLDPRYAPEIRTRMKEGVGASIFASVVGVAIGVWALIVVLSVMAGFSGELQDRIIRTKEHLRISAREGIAAPFDLAAGIARQPGVRFAAPFVEGEAMMSSSLNISSTVTIRGIVPDGEVAEELEKSLVAGSVAFLRHPEDLVPFPGLPPASRFFPDEEWSSDEPDPTVVPAPDGLLPMPDIPDDDLPSQAMAERPSPTESETTDPSTVLPPLPLLGEEEGDEAFSGSSGTDYRPSRFDVEVQPPVIIGVELARSLGVSVGSRITLISPDGEIGPLGVQPRARSFHVAGIFSTGMYDSDLKLAYMPLPEAQRFFDLGDRIDLLDVRLFDIETAGAVRDRLAASATGNGLEIQTLQEMNRNLFSALKLERIVMFVVLGFIILIASFNIVASLLILIWKRVGAIAILRTVGAVRGDVMRIFFLLGATSGLFGIASGVIMGLSSCGVIRHLGITLPREYYIRSLPVHVDGFQVLLVAIAALLITAGAALYPGRLAARIELVQGLKDER